VAAVTEQHTRCCVWQLGAARRCHRCQVLHPPTPTVMWASAAPPLSVVSTVFCIEYIQQSVICMCAAPAPVPAGYTPLHMASGYMHTGPMAALLEAGADPLIKDKQGVC
jgi:hypothetical protein